MALSFYKMFGYPTGVGALIARKEALARLHRPWFAGGTINVASVQADRFVLTPGATGFEDGTPDFTNIPAVEVGLELLQSIGIERIHDARAGALGLADRASFWPFATATGARSYGSMGRARPRAAAPPWP